MIESITAIFERDLHLVKKEIGLFHTEKNLWRTSGSIHNSAGNLCLHIVGNLNTYIGKHIGETGYVRNREAEFTLKNVSREELIHKVEQTKEIVGTILTDMQDSELQKKYPEEVLGYEMTTGFFLIHLHGHLSYHLGQINYLRRILE